jgi:2-dehydropantoate 2-reductase
MKQDTKFCVVGCGAIGGLISARLAASGFIVRVIDRSRQLEAIRREGLRLITADGEPDVEVRLEASDTFDYGPQDYIFLAVKSHQIAEVAGQLARLMHTNTAIVTLQNGLPWWYFQRHVGGLGEKRLEEVDPGGVISRHIDSHRVIGCVAYPAATVEQWGVIRHVEGNRLPVGELDSSTSRRCRDLSQFLTTAGFKSPVLTNVREEIWLKLWGALAFNPVSMLTGETLQDMCRNPSSRAIIIAMMQEAEVIAGRLGIGFRVPLDRRLAGAEQVGAHKTSTLQDLEAGQPTELGALLGAVIELGRLTHTPTPHMDKVYADCLELERKAIRPTK